MTRTTRRTRWWLGAGFIALASFGAAYYFDSKQGHPRRRMVAAGLRRAMTPATGSGGSTAPDGTERPSGWPREAPPDVDSEGNSEG